jgi:outer membrane protein assembly factor BamB
MRSFWLAAAIGCAAVVLAGGSASASVSTSNWAQNGGGATRHASNPTERVLGRFNVAKLTLQGTRIDADGGGLLRPIIDSGTVFTIVRQSAGNAIEAFTESGTPLWTTDFTAAFENNFAISDGVIVAADFYGSLYGIDEATGQQLWSAPSGGTSAQPVIANGVVYVDRQSTHRATAARPSGATRSSSTCPERCMRSTPATGTCSGRAHAQACRDRGSLRRWC